MEREALVTNPILVAITSNREVSLSHEDMIGKRSRSQQESIRLLVLLEVQFTLQQE